MNNPTQIPKLCPENDQRHSKFLPFCDDFSSNLNLLPATQI
jgi:hypothetical protein